ncbi:MAG: prolyl oligopeptidase family serine peptidase, partial [Bacillota bacterium]
MRYDIERYLNVRNAGSPTWSPDGERIAYLTNITGVPQVWQVGRKGGYPQQITYLRERISLVTYSPRQDMLIYGMDHGGNERQQLYALSMDGSDARDLSGEPEVVHHFGGWSPDGTQICLASNQRHPAFFDIYTQDAATGLCNLVVQNDGTNYPNSWSPDGASILFNRPTGLTNNDLFLLTLANNEVRHLTPHEGLSAFRQPIWSRDGKGLFLRTDINREFAALVYLDLESGEMQTIFEDQWDVELHDLSHDGRYVALTLNEHGYSHLMVLDHTTGEQLPIPTMPNGVITSLEWSPVSLRLALSFVSGKCNSDIWVVDMTDNSATQVTYSSRAGIQQDGFVEPELVSYPTFDGREIPAWLYRPIGKNGSLPVVISIHGGPESQERPGFNPNIQYLVNQGFAVLAPNVRGSTGYGKEYNHLDDVRKRMDSVKDIGYAVRWLRSSGTAQPNKIAVMGGSYG